MNITDMLSAAGVWAPTVVLIGLVLGFFVSLGRSASAPAARQTGSASTFAQHQLRAALAGVGRLNELSRRRALPPWGDLDEPVSAGRRPVGLSRNGSSRGD